MSEHKKWWDSLPYERKKYLSYKEHWTTVDEITDHQIKMIYEQIDNY